MKALVIDDSRAMRALLQAMMRELGFEVVQAGDGQEALTRLQEMEKCDIALVDWNMPVMDGFDFVKAVRAENRWQDVRLMMVTTETEMAQVIKAIEAGANEYVMKPFTKDIIIDKLHLLGLQ